jgi:hypothetical protein
MRQGRVAVKPPGVNVLDQEGACIGGVTNREWPDWIACPCRPEGMLALPGFRTPRGTAIHTRRRVVHVRGE